MAAAAEFLEQSRRKPCSAAAIAILALALLTGGCAAPQTAPRNAYRPAAAPADADAAQPPIPADSAAFARFTAPAADNMQSPAYFQAVQRAAALAAARQYKYFVLAQQPAAAAAAPPSGQSRAPALGISYGRQPYGFGDAGGEYGPPGLGISVSPSLFTIFSRRQKTDAPAQWLVYMLNEPSRRAALALFAGSPPPMATALIYNARAPNAPPLALRLR